MRFSDLEVNESLQNKRTILVTTPNGTENEEQFLRRIDGGKTPNNEPIWEMKMDNEQATAQAEEIEIPKEVIDCVTISPLPLDRETLEKHIRSEVVRLSNLTREEFEAEMTTALRQGGKTEMVGSIFRLAVEERIRRDMAAVGVDLNQVMNGKKTSQNQVPVRTPSLKFMFPGLGSKAKTKK
jgi:hypothetical protein